MKKVLAAVLAITLMLVFVPAMAEETQSVSIADPQKLDAAYTLALNAINAEDYETAKEYLDICFVYCDPRDDSTLYQIE